jgi:NADH:ubiquinone oxidoreductase subunit 6 (subunit J)
VSWLDLAFAAVGVVAAASGLLAVTTRHVVHAALWLVVCLGSIAGCYLVLGAELVALVQVLVYVGAVVVLVLFALMLTRAPIGPRAEISTGRLHRVLAAVLGAGVTALLASVLLPLAHPVDRHETDTTVLSRDLFGTWVWPFEVLTLLLLVALVAALAESGVGARRGDGRVEAARAEAELQGATGDPS